MISLPAVVFDVDGTLYDLKILRVIKKPRDAFPNGFD